MVSSEEKKLALDRAAQEALLSGEETTDIRAVVIHYRNGAKMQVYLAEDGRLDV